MSVFQSRAVTPLLNIFIRLAPARHSMLLDTDVAPYLGRILGERVSILGNFSIEQFGRAGRGAASSKHCT